MIEVPNTGLMLFAAYELAFVPLAQMSAVTTFMFTSGGPVGIALGFIMSLSLLAADSFILNSELASAGDGLNALNILDFIYY
jgi:hypothetical protein